MSAVLAWIFLCTTAVALTGWWNATQKIVSMETIVDLLSDKKFDDPA
jgi:uncharacterized membrane protein